MPTCVVFDTHFPGRFLAWPDEEAKAAILECVDRGELELWASLEVLEELMGIVTTRQRDRLVPLAESVLRLTKGRILALGEFLIASELRGEPQRELEAEPRDQVLAFLRQLAGGHIPSATPNIAGRALQAKAHAAGQLRELRDQARAVFPNLGRGDLTRITFKEVDELHWQKKGEGFVRRYCMEYDVPDPEGTARRVVEDPARYPRVRNRMRAFSLLLHRYLVSGQRIEDGDVYDVRQMVYLNDCEVFVTDEGRFRERCREIFGDSKQIVSVTEFMSHTWC